MLTPFRLPPNARAAEADDRLPGVLQHSHQDDEHLHQGGARSAAPLLSVCAEVIRNASGDRLDGY